MTEQFVAKKMSFFKNEYEAGGFFPRVYFRFAAQIDPNFAQMLRL